MHNKISQWVLACIIKSDIYYIIIIKKSVYLDIAQQGTLAILDLAVACASVMASTCHWMTSAATARGDIYYIK